MSCTYLAHHELESKFIVIIIIVIVIVIISIIIIIIIIISVPVQVGFQSDGGDQQGVS